MAESSDSVETSGSCGKFVNYRVSEFRSYVNYLRILWFARKRDLKLLWITLHLYNSRKRDYYYIDYFTSASYKKIAIYLNVSICPFHISFKLRLT